MRTTMLVPMFGVVLALSACGSDDNDGAASSATTTTVGATTTTMADTYNEYIGLTEEAALAKAEAAGVAARVNKRDGEALPVTMDYNPERLNFEIEDDKVVAVTTG